MPRIVWSEFKNYYMVDKGGGHVSLHQASTNACIYSCVIRFHAFPSFITKNQQEWAVVEHTFIHCNSGKTVRMGPTPEESWIWKWQDLKLSPDGNVLAIYVRPCGYDYGWITFVDFQDPWHKTPGYMDTQPSMYIVEDPYTARLEWITGTKEISPITNPSAGVSHHMNQCIECIAWCGLRWHTWYDLCWQMMEYDNGSITNKENVPLELMDVVICGPDGDIDVTRESGIVNERYRESFQVYNSGEESQRNQRFQFKPLHRIQFSLEHDAISFVAEKSWNYPCQSWKDGQDV